MAGPTEGHSEAFSRFIAARPQLAEAVAQLGEVVWEGPAVDPVLKERARIAASEAIGSSFCVAFRTMRDGRPLVAETPDEAEDARTKVAEEFARQLVENTGAVDPDVVVTLHQEFEPEEITDLVFSTAYFVGNTLIMKALRLE